MSSVDDPRVEELLSQYNVPKAYSEDEPAVEEAAELSVDVEDEIDDRVDLRDQYAITIDPDNAKDYDDAIAIDETDDGYTAWVHIADVTHYVDEGTAIDDAAKNRGVTFYLDEYTRHMLPGELASDICSLVEEEDRLAHTVEMDLEQEAGGEYEITDFDIYESVVNIDDGLSYSRADAIIDQQVHDAPKGTETLIEDADQLTEDLLDDRWDQSLVLNPNNRQSERIIEELMLKANQAVARHFLDEGKPGVYRVMEQSGQGAYEDIEDDLRDEGYDDKPHGWLTEADNPKKTINDFIAHEVDDEVLEDVRTAVVTKLQPAHYATRNDDHYALGFDEYAQFTSPIRRVGDLVNHRQVKADAPEGGQEFVKTAKTLSDVVTTLNLQHDNAKAADRRYDELFPDT